MEINRKIQTSPPRKQSQSEKINKIRELKPEKKYNISKKIKNNGESTKIMKKKPKNIEENAIINLQTEKVIGKLYKKTNETEWAAQNRAIKEKHTTNYDIKQILKRYYFNKNKLKYGYSNEYLNLVTELLYLSKKDYSKDRLQLCKYRINFSKKKNKDNTNFINNILNKSENKKDYLKQRMTISAIPSSYNNLLNINTNINDTYKNNTKNNNFYSAKNPNKTIFLNKELYKKNIYLNSGILKKNDKNLFLNEKIKLKDIEFKNNIKTEKFNNLVNIPNKTNTIYINAFNKSKNYNLNLSNKSLDKSENWYSLHNSPKKKIYKNERDIYFEKEKELDQFLVTGDKDKYEDYLKNKFKFFVDMEDKQTQYLQEIKKRSITIFNNKNVEMQDSHKRVTNYLDKLSRGREMIENGKKYKIHDLFKKNYTAQTLNKLKINYNSKKILQNLKYSLK